MRARWSAVLLSLLAVACEGPVDPIDKDRPPLPDKVMVALSESTLSLLPGETRSVRVSVAGHRHRLELRTTGLPSRVAATFSPAVLEPGMLESELLLSADPAASASAVTATVNAVSSSGASVSSAQLNVQVCTGYAQPDRCPPFPTGGPGMVSGVIRHRTSSGSTPLAGAELWLWVQMPANGYVRGHVTSDAVGRFSFDQIPVGATVMLQAWSSHIDQPCASTVVLSGASGTVDVEVTSIAEPVSVERPQPPALTGVVWEQTAAGRTPVAGARVYFDILLGLELIAATTTTDSEGRYTLCRLPTIGVGHSIWVWKPGYRLENVPVSVSEVMQADVQLTWP